MAEPGASNGAAAGASSSTLLSSIDFTQLNSQLESEKELGEQIREQAKAVEKVYRKITSHLNKMHATPAEQMSEVLVRPTQVMFQEARKKIAALAELVPENRYYQVSTRASLSTFLARLNQSGIYSGTNSSTTKSDRYAQSPA
jgi:hypothetical protein